MKCSISLLAGALLAVSFSASALALDSQEVGYNIEARGARPVALDHQSDRPDARHPLPFRARPRTT